MCPRHALRRLHAPVRSFNKAKHTVSTPIPTLLPRSPPPCWLPALADQRTRSQARLARAALRARWQSGRWGRQSASHLLARMHAALQLRHPQAAQRPAERDAAPGDELLRQLAEHTDEVFWIYEPHSDRYLYVSPAYERQWQCSAKALYEDPRQWLSPVHHDDRLALQQALNGLPASDGHAVEYRRILRTGEERWISERAFPVAGHGGRPRVAGLSQDITARKATELELRRSVGRKDEFLAMVAHELRNPLHPIRTAASLLARLHASDPAGQRKAVAVIERQVNHMARLVDDLQDLTRINHGKVRLQLQALRLADVLGAAVDANRTLAEQHCVQLRLDLPADEVWLRGDPVRLTQVFSNLLHNAIKFSLATGTVEISVRPDDQGQVAVSVRDEGIGIAPELVGSIFDLFVQAGQPAGHDHGGLGIGLSVARSLVLLHGGAVSAHSEGVARGSEFIVTLATTPAPDATGPAPVQQRHHPSLPG
jgi:PAS domain S-box-containing protein